MNSELMKRIITSIILLLHLLFMILYTYVLIVSIIIIAVIVWVEFYALISKIFLKKNIKDKALRFLCKATSLLYLIFLVCLILITKSKNPQLEIFIIYSILVSIMSDIGGLVVGRIFKGRKLTKISPKKTISGSIGSFVFSLFLIPFFVVHLPVIDPLILFIITLIISLTSQFGDLFISLLKRKSKVKDTSDLLPGHGGVLDRIDGIIFSIPIGFLILNFFKI